MDRDTLAQIMQGQQVAANDTSPPMTPQQMQIRLNQLLYDRNISRKLGVTIDDTYAPNAEIDRFRKMLRGQG